MNDQILGNPNLSESQRLRLGYTNSGDVPAQHIRWNGVYELPFGKGKHFGNYRFRRGEPRDRRLVGGLHRRVAQRLLDGRQSQDGYYLFGDPTLSKDERFTVDIFGRKQQVYFRGYFDPTEATGPNADQAGCNWCRPTCVPAGAHEGRREQQPDSAGAGRRVGGSHQRQSPT